MSTTSESDSVEVDPKNDPNDPKNAPNGPKNDLKIDAQLDAHLDAQLDRTHDGNPYPDVRAVTDPYDDDTKLCLTWRVWVLGTIWVGLGAFVTQFFELPSFWEPQRMVDQEQLLATIMLNCAGGTPYVAQNILVQYMPMFYNQRWAGGFGYGFLVILVTQFMGFGFSGLLRRVGAYPVTAMWPTVLPTLAVNKVLLAPGRKGENINGDLDVELAHVGSPPKRPFGLVTGSISGMGFNPVPTFDWNVITGIIEPILISFHSALNQYLGMFLSGLVTLAVYDCNSKWTRWIPINDNSLFDNTGRPFDVKLILTNYQFDDTKYRQYSPPYFSAASLVLYGANFALYPMAFVYSILCHWREMGTAIGETWDTFRPPHPSNYEGLDDPFCRIQKKHPDVPDWWDTPVWIIFLCLGMCCAFLLLFCIFYSMSGVMLNLNVLGELFVGYALPGKLQALSTAKALMMTIAEQAMNFAQDQKQTHYAHLPPRSIFGIQLGIVIFFTVQYNDHALNWWGNSVSYAGMDGQGVSTPQLPENGYFGPGPGQFP
ncbi:OPT oligopeptide transporter protein-domain-containing protein [Yarrowia lipolytica]|uniref:OPT oligopeptide transporter protein-domain-containing protein n=1 Tax=Yarrowia lipolytica TaxID=4952 RepID=A0A1D8N6W3_YARLL|nr:hypothetical protein YALI1_B10288g [Yarrowia lipolytica]KAE8171577.1 OPT oligopeptide transporter protein-domain-containing protein [Yarrowia lipolytica]